MIHKTTPDLRPPLLQVENLHVQFPMPQKFFQSRNNSYIHAVNGVTFSIDKGQTLGLVGESGCGKSTIAYAIVGLYKASSGHVYYEEQNIATMKQSKSFAARKNIQMVFQDPYSSLNPRMTVRAILAEPIQVYMKHGLVKMRMQEIEHRINELLLCVGLSTNAKHRYPHNFSTGERQRINIARALMLKPKIILVDEVVSALDVSIQAQIINLFKDLQKRLDLSLLFISHDLAVVKHVSHKIAIMYCGKIIEIGDVATVYENPLHPYTQALLSAVNIPDPIIEKKRSRISLKGSVPVLTSAPRGCPFYSRCSHAMAKCKQHEPPLLPVDTNNSDRRRVACFLHTPC